MLDARQITLELPQPGAIEWVDGQPVRFDRDSEEFRSWYRTTPVRPELMTSMVNTYAAAWVSASSFGGSALTVVCIRSSLAR